MVLEFHKGIINFKTQTNTPGIEKYAATGKRSVDSSKPVHISSICNFGKKFLPCTAAKMLAII